MTPPGDGLEAVAKVAPDLIPEGRPMLPEEVEQLLAHLGNRIARGGFATARAFEAYSQARYAFDMAYARAYMAHEGPQTEKRQAATVATDHERVAMDVAEVHYKTCQSQLRALEKAASVAQSIGASARQMVQGSSSGRGY